MKSNAVIFLSIVLCVQCAGGRRAGIQVSPPVHEVYVVSNNFHTGLVIGLDVTARRVLSFSEYFMNHGRVDIGWGDEVIYQEAEIRTCPAVRAMMIPSSSVIRVEGFDAEMKDVVAWSGRAARFRLSDVEFIRLCEFIEASLTKDCDGKPAVASRHGGDVIFFRSPHLYHMFNTCNTWIARALNHAGADISPVCAITAGTLFRRMEKSGEILK